MCDIPVLCLLVELVDEVQPAEAVFPLWFVILLTLMLLTVICISAAVVLTLCQHLTSASTVTVKGSAYVRMEAGDSRWNFYNPERHRLWTLSHLEHSLPPPLHTAINIPAVRLIVMVEYTS